MINQFNKGSVNKGHLLLTVLCWVAFISLSSFRLPGKYIIYYGKNSSDIERATCEDLKHDLIAVTHAMVSVAEEPATIPATNDFHILVGSVGTSILVHELAAEGTLNISASLPGKGGGMIKVVMNRGQKLLVFAGSDVEGTQNTVYSFCTQNLGIDPFSYWSGYKATVNTNYNVYTTLDREVPPPVVPVICYFENDVDELANMKKPYLEYDMDTWKGMVNSLRRIHYNAIQLFDMLGRAEFFTRAPYKKLRPGYHTNLKLVDSLINYAHLKGMQIQVDLNPGYEMQSLTDSEAVCWSRYKQKWIDTWVYYLTKTPLGKADIFSLRPRNQVWDRPYASSCGENKSQVFNEVYASLDSVLHIYKPHAEKLCICYGDGMDMFNDGFNPPKDFTVVWSDNGYCDFEQLPVSTKSYQFGTYMHAGFWKNHTVHDPYPEKIDSVMTLMAKKFHATKYLEVNGQTFRPFLLNLEAFGQWAYNPQQFNGKSFYSKWASYYFGIKAAPFVTASMTALHLAQFGRNGYVENLSEIKRLIAFLESPAKSGPSVKGSSFLYKGIDFAVSQRLEYITTSLKQATGGLPVAKDQQYFYYDYIDVPALMYDQLLQFEKTLCTAAKYKWNYEQQNQDKDDLNKAKDRVVQASVQLKAIYKTCFEGDKNKQWATWYDPSKRRPNNGFPTQEMLASIIANLQKMQ